MKRRGRWWSSVGIGVKLSMIPAIFVLAIVVLVSLTTNAIQDQRAAASRVNLASSMRVLTNRHFKEVLLTRAGVDADYQSTRTQLKEALKVLRGGGGLTTDLDLQEAVPSTQDPTLLGLLGRQEELLPQAIQASDELLALPPGAADIRGRLIRLQDVTEDLSSGNRAMVVQVVRLSNEALGLIMRLQWTLAVISVVFGSALAWSISRSILSALADCVTAAEEIGAGNLTGQPVEVSSDDEVGKLGDSFNAMRSKLRELLGSLSGAVETLGASSSQILAAAQQQAAGASEQAASIQETTSTMEEVGQTGSQIAERARMVAAEAEATSKASAVGIDGVRQAALAMDGIRRQVEAVAENVVMLTEKTQAVGEVIAAVKDIAERSNLLALNAAIEAASAGEDGRGFAIVAGEMKSLAEQSREATTTVRRILEEIQRGINSSVMLTEEAVKRVESGRQHTEKAENTIRDLNQKVKDSVQAFQQITAATNQQLIGYDQVAHAMRNIEMTTEQTAAATRQLEASVVALNDLSGSLRTSTERYRL